MLGSGNAAALAKALKDKSDEEARLERELEEAKLIAALAALTTSKEKR